MIEFYIWLPLMYHVSIYSEYRSGSLKSVLVSPHTDRIDIERSGK